MDNVEKYISLHNELMQAQKDLVDTVRKETAKEILQAVYNEWFKSETIDLFVKNLAEKYGVEVDE